MMGKYILMSFLLVAFKVMFLLQNAETHCCYIVGSKHIKAFEKKAFQTVRYVNWSWHYIT